MRKTSPALALSAALLALAAAGCAAGESADSAPPPSAALPSGPAHATLGTFVMHVKPRQGKVVIERLREPAAAGLGRRGEALDSLPIVSDNVAGSGPDYTVELVTDQNSFVDTYNAGPSGGCAANSWCANVTLRHFYPGIDLSGAYVVATQITDAQGALDTTHVANNSVASNPFGLNATYGLWQYTTLGANGTTLAKGAGATQTWSFKNPDDADVSVKLEVRGALYPMLWFDTSGVTQTASLQAGQPASLHYNYARLGSCRGSNWMMNAFLKGDYIDQHMMSYPGQASDTFFDVHMVMPFGPGVAFWFENKDSDGCDTWDSSGGANFNFGVADSYARIRFAGPTASSNPHSTPNWQVYADPTVKTGATVHIDYDLDRVICGSLDRYGRVPAGTTATLWYRYDGRNGAYTPISMLGAPPASINGTTGQIYVPPSFTIPPGHTDLWIYFDSTDGTGCHKYDSGPNNNFSFGPL